MKERFHTVAKFMKTIGRIQLFIAKLLEELKAWFSKKIFSAGEVQTVLDQLMLSMQPELKELCQEIRDQQLTADELKYTISLAILGRDKESNNTTFDEKDNSYDLLGILQDALCDAIDVNSLDQLTDNDISKRFKSNLKAFHQSNPSLFQPQNLSTALNFIKDRALTLEASFDSSPNIIDPNKKFIAPPKLEFSSPVEPYTNMPPPRPISQSYHKIPGILSDHFLAEQSQANDSDKKTNEKKTTHDAVDPIVDMYEKTSLPTVPVIAPINPNANTDHANPNESELDNHLAPKKPTIKSNTEFYSNYKSPPVPPSQFLAEQAKAHESDQKETEKKTTPKSIEAIATIYKKIAADLGIDTESFSSQMAALEKKSPEKSSPSSYESDFEKLKLALDESDQTLKKNESEDDLTTKVKKTIAKVNSQLEPPATPNHNRTINVPEPEVAEIEYQPPIAKL